MNYFLIILAVLLGRSAFAADGVTLHVPHFHDILKPNSQLECRYVSDQSFGFLLERGSGEKIRVSAITNGINEGDKSAFEMEIKTKQATGLHLYLYERKGQFGKYIEFQLENRVSSALNYQLPGRFMQVSAMYVPGEDGKEVENLYPDVSKRLACRIP